MKLEKQFMNKRITSTKKEKPLKIEQNEIPEILELNNTKTALKNEKKSFTNKLSQTEESNSEL